MTNTYRAFVLSKDGDTVGSDIEQRNMSMLEAGNVTIRVAWSSINYKDGLAALSKGGIVRDYPRVPGIDLSGAVTESADSRFKEGESVLVTGFGTGVSHDGGYAEYARVPGDWVVKCPENLPPREAMIFGTAGFTAALAIQRLEHQGIKPASGPILVTGATGGVGSMTISMLSKLGYEVHASTGKTAEHNYLKLLGANTILSRDDVNTEGRPLEKEKWAGAVDQVGGDTLSWILSTLEYGGAVACTGLTGGAKFRSTVMPLLLRGVSVLGVDSVMYPAGPRAALWHRMAEELKPDNLELIAEELDLSQILPVLQEILKGTIRGRRIVKLD
jgi:acrylyl-CoA reductase (NADPH)